MKRFVFIMTLIVLLGVGVVTACAEQPESPQTSEEMRQEDRDIDTDRHPSNEQAHEGTWSQSEPGRIIHAVQPPPGGSFKGLVSVRARIGTDGSVLETTIMRSSGKLLYDRTACRLVETEWVFRPAMVNGEYIVSNIMCPVYFNMKPKHRAR